MRTALASPAAMFSYSRSKGLFAGISLEGTVLIERKQANQGLPIHASRLGRKGRLMCETLSQPSTGQPFLRGTFSQAESPRQRSHLVRAETLRLCPARSTALTPAVNAALYEVIEAAEGIDESTVPAESYVPAADGGRLPVAVNPNGGSTAVFDASKEGL